MAEVHPTSTDLQEPLLPSQENGNAEQQPAARVATDKDIVLKLCSKQVILNHNVFLTLLLDVMYGISDSLWSGTVFAAYLKRLGGEQNGPVGDIEAVNGLAVLFSALPVGYLADKYGRSIVITAGGALFIVTAICHASIMEWIGTDDNLDPKKTDVAMVLLAIVMGMWGIGGGIVSGPCQALYADSTPAGDRSKYYFYVFVCYILASCLGPIISIILFQTIGDDWDLSNLRTIIYVGLGLEMMNAVVMMFFDDKKALDEEEEEGETTVNANDGEARDVAAESNGGVATEDCENGERNGEVQALVSGVEEEATAAELLKKRQKWIPYIVFAASVVMSIGSGMTVKFFPLFFKDEVGMSPTEVQIVYVIVPIVMVMCSGLGTSLSSWFGRVQTTLLLEISGVSCLYVMVFFKGYLDTHPFVLVPIYVARTALMNSPYPLQESILMDFVPKDERARWKSLESISQFGWCGSAALGGFFSDRWDYTFTFFITAIIQTMGILTFSLLLPLVPRREKDLSRSTSNS